jgi:hypothetical protein
MTTLNTPQPAHKADMATLRMALRKMHRRACGDESAVYMSIPADRERDADLLLEDALDELANYRALEAPARTAHLAPGAEPTPRDMRVAEAVYFDALSDFLPEGLRASDREHLAAVVAKAVGT